MSEPDYLETFYAHVRPLAAEGNEFAVKMLLRVMVAEDPEAEARAQMATVIAAVNAIGDVCRAFLGSLGLGGSSD